MLGCCGNNFWILMNIFLKTAVASWNPTAQYIIQNNQNTDLSFEERCRTTAEWVSNLLEHGERGVKKETFNRRQLKVSFFFQWTCAYLLNATIHPSLSFFLPSSLLLIQHLRIPPPALHSAPSLLSPSLHPCQLPWNAAFTLSAKGTIGWFPGNGAPSEGIVSMSEQTNALITERSTPACPKPRSAVVWPR